jgi:hypothetical protein
MNKTNIAIRSLLAALILTGCVVSNPKFFSTIEPGTDPSYGYTTKNPVTIRNGDLNNSIGSSYYYISRLRTKNGHMFKIISQSCVENPNYKKPAVPLQNRFTGEPLRNGTGPLLDRYLLKADNETDTVTIYINPYHKGKVQIPGGLLFEKE